MWFLSLRQWLGVELIEVSVSERWIAALGGGLSIWILVGLTAWAVPGSGALAIIASMGASAVLLFAVPHGPLSQPWPVIAGHGISAIIGVACARFIPQPQVAAACAVGLAIGAMQLLKCIHPPGGATALSAVMGGSAIQSLGFGFVLFPVLSNAAAMVLLAVLINSVFKWRRYPAICNQPAQAPPPASPGSLAAPSHEEVVTALRALDSFVDISEADLLHLVQLLGHPTHEATRAPENRGGHA